MNPIRLLQYEGSIDTTAVEFTPLNAADKQMIQGTRKAEDAYNTAMMRLAIRYGDMFKESMRWNIPLDE